MRDGVKRAGSTASRGFALGKGCMESPTAYGRRFGCSTSSRWGARSKAIYGVGNLRARSAAAAFVAFQSPVSSAIPLTTTV